MCPPYDVFICHAGEDKKAVARPLSQCLEKLGLKVWLDADSIHAGDSVRLQIDEALRQSTCIVVICSENLRYSKGAQLELNALHALEFTPKRDQHVVVPVYYKVDHDYVYEYIQPLLADKSAILIGDDVSPAAEQILSIVKRKRPSSILFAFADADSGTNRLIAEECEELVQIFHSEHHDHHVLPLLSRAATPSRILQELGNIRNSAICGLHYSANGVKARIDLDEPIAPEQRSDSTFISLLAKQNLEFVFLNACATMTFATELYNHGVPVVIATHLNINPHCARHFAVTFYDRLSRGRSLQKAYDHSITELAVRWKEPSDWLQDDFNAGDFAIGDVKDICRILGRQGASVGTGWSFPYAEKKLPVDRFDGPLPNKPFPGMRPYTEHDARLLLGRDRDIIDLADRVRQSHGRLILVCGPSGVGKSSLLNAGLRNFLERDKDVSGEPIPPHEVRYVSLEPGQNAVHVLQRVLRLDTSGVDATDLADAWGREDRITRPLTVVIDQFEEELLRLDNAPATAKTDLLEVLRKLSTYPLHGKLILACRDDFQEDARELLEDVTQHFATYPVAQLSKDEIESVVATLLGSEVIRKRYNIEVDGNPSVVAARIASDIASDIVRNSSHKSSPRAPVLQYILTIMYERARHSENGEVRVFDERLYEGIILEKGAHSWRRRFLIEQLTAMGRPPENRPCFVRFKRTQSAMDWKQAVVSSGLALDLLYELTTRQSALSREEITQTYFHVGEDLRNSIIGRLLDVRLVCNVGPTKIRLADESLRDAIRDEWLDSQSRAAEARRLVEQNRHYNGKELRTIRNGRNAMRRISSDEQRRLDRSARKQSVRMGVLIGAAIIVLLFAGLGARQYRTAVVKFVPDSRNRGLRTELRIARARDFPSHDRWQELGWPLDGFLNSLPEPDEITTGIYQHQLRQEQDVIGLVHREGLYGSWKSSSRLFEQLLEQLSDSYAAELRVRAGYDSYDIAAALGHVTLTEVRYPHFHTRGLVEGAARVGVAGDEYGGIAVAEIGHRPAGEHAFLVLAMRVQVQAALQKQTGDGAHARDDGSVSVLLDKVLQYLQSNGVEFHDEALWVIRQAAEFDKNISEDEATKDIAKDEVAEAILNRVKRWILAPERKTAGGNTQESVLRMLIDWPQPDGDFVSLLIDHLNAEQENAPSNTETVYSIPRLAIDALANHARRTDGVESQHQTAHRSRAVKALITSLTKSGNLGEQVSAAKALLDIAKQNLGDFCEDEESRTALKGALLTMLQSPSAEIVEPAARCLAQFGPPDDDVVEAFLYSLVGEDGLIFQPSLRALEQMSEPAGTDERDSTDVVTRVVKSCALRRDAEELAIAALVAIGHLQLDHVEELKAAFKSDNALSGCAAISLGLLAQNKCLDDKTRDEVIRLFEGRLSRTLALKDGADSPQESLQSIESPNSPSSQANVALAHNIIHALGMMCAHSSDSDDDTVSEDPAYRTLIDHLETASLLRIPLLHSLAEHGCNTDEFIEILLELLDSSDIHERIAAAGCLQIVRIPDGQANDTIERLVQRLGERQPRLNDTEAAFDAFHLVLGSREIEQRRSAAEALVSLDLKGLDGAVERTLQRATDTLCNALLEPTRAQLLADKAESDFRAQRGDDDVEDDSTIQLTANANSVRRQDRSLRVAAIKALGALADYWKSQDARERLERIAGCMRKAAVSEDHSVSEAAAKWLGEFGPHAENHAATISALIDAMRNENILSRVVRESLLAMSNAGYKELVGEQLLQELKDTLRQDGTGETIATPAEFAFHGNVILVLTNLEWNLANVIELVTEAVEHRRSLRHTIGALGKLGSRQSPTAREAMITLLSPYTGAVVGDRISFVDHSVDADILAAVSCSVANRAIAQLAHGLYDEGQLLAMLKDRRSEYRRTASIVLGSRALHASETSDKQTISRSTIDQLFDLSENDTTWWVRVAAFDTLVRLENQKLRKADNESSASGHMTLVAPSEGSGAAEVGVN